MKIVSMMETGKRKKTVLIITEEEEIQVAARFCAQHRLAEGMEIEDHVWDMWLMKWQGRRAMDGALRYLGYKSRSWTEMSRYLRKKGYASAVRDSVMEKLKGYGYLEDGRYVADFMESCLTAKPMGRIRIKAALREKGIGDELIEESLLAYGEEAELAQALVCLKKQMVLRRGKSPQIQKQQSYAALARRGFNWEMIQRAWGRMESDTEDGT